MWFFKKRTKNIVYSPASGEVIDLKLVDDGVFSEKMLGDGVAITNANDQIKIYSPIDGVVKSVFPTKHAYGISSTNGIEILIHIGIDSASLDGKGFISHVEQGANVQVGDLLATVDLAYLRSVIENTSIIIIVLPESNKQNLKEVSSGTIKAKEQLFRVF